MKKFTASISLIVAFTFYALLASTRSGGQQISVPAPVASVPVTGAANSGSAPASTNTLSSPPASSNSSATGMKNGVYTGPVVNAYYGNVQVQATISGGKLTDVAFLQYPTDRRTSQQINSRATVQLKSEAIQSQSAKVDMVSGATETSTAFKASLGAALAQASI